MNKIKRSRLHQAIDFIEQAKMIVEDVRDEEDQCFENLSEGLKASQRGSDMEDAVEQLNEAVEYLGQIIAMIQDVI